MNDDPFKYLIDPGELEHTICTLREAIEGRGTWIVAETFSNLYVTPIQNYLEKEYRRIDARKSPFDHINVVAKAAERFLDAAEDVRDGLSEKDLCVENVNIFEREWKEWLVSYAGSGLLMVSVSAKKRRAKRTTWAGMTKAEIQTRNEELRAKFANGKLTKHGFAVRHAKLKTYKSGNGGHLSWRGILKVLNSLP